jgi:hypothetical protein
MIKLNIEALKDRLDFLSESQFNDVIKELASVLKLDESIPTSIHIWFMDHLGNKIISNTGQDIRSNRYVANITGIRKEFISSVIFPVFDYNSKDQVVFKVDVHIHELFKPEYKFNSVQSITEFTNIIAEAYDNVVIPLNEILKEKLGEVLGNKVTNTIRIDYVPLLIYPTTFKINFTEDQYLSICDLDKAVTCSNFMLKAFNIHPSVVNSVELPPIGYGIISTVVYQMQVSLNFIDLQAFMYMNPCGYNESVWTQK